jgi:hypothetical protein
MEYLYDERAPRGRPVAAASVYLGAVAWAGVVTLPHDLGAWLAVAAMLLLLLVACLAVTLSRSVHHRIQLSPETLRVGWERIPVDQLDPASISPGADLPDTEAASRAGRAPSSSIADLPAGATPPREPRLVGGGAGVPAGMSRVVVLARSGEQLCIATRDRTALVAALRQATGRRPRPDAASAPASSPATPSPAAAPSPTAAPSPAAAAPAERRRSTRPRSGLRVVAVSRRGGRR